MIWGEPTNARARAININSMIVTIIIISSSSSSSSIIMIIIMFIIMIMNAFPTGTTCPPARADQRVCPCTQPSRR